MKLSEIADFLGGTLEGSDIDVTGISGADEAADDFLTFMESDKYRQSVLSSRACAVIIPAQAKAFEQKPVVRVKNPRLAFALLLAVFHKRPSKPAGIHPTAVIGSNVSIGDNVTIGPFAVLEDNAVIGSGSEISAHCFIGDGARIGTDSILRHRVSIMRECVIGDRVLIHPGAVIGADGFGFVRDGARQIKIPQVGIVFIGDDVEIGANTTIDRATTGKTVIGCGTKIDNLVQIGHNTSVGRDCTIVSQSGIAGSTKIGDRVVVAAQAGIRDHTEIGSDSVIGGRAGVTKPVKSGAIVSGYPARDHREELRIEAAIARLPELAVRVENLSEKIAILESAY